MTARRGWIRGAGIGLIALGSLGGAFVLSTTVERAAPEPPRGDVAPSPGNVAADGPAGAPDAARARPAEGDAGTTDDARCVRVRVVDLSGAAAEADVWMHSRVDLSVPWRGGARTRTDHAGEAEPCAPPAEYLSIRARTSDGREGRSWVRPADSTDAPLRVVVTRPAWVRGRVVDLEGRPVEGARILVGQALGDTVRTTAMGDSSLHYATEPAESGPDGRFEVGLVGLQTFQVGAAAEGLGVGWDGPFPGRPGVEHEARVVLRPLATLDVTVTHDGRPIPGATVRVGVVNLHRRDPVHTLEDGRLVLPRQHPDVRYRLYVRAPGHVPDLLDDVDHGPHVVELDRGATLEVDVSTDPSVAGCFGGEPFYPDMPTPFGGAPRLQGRLTVNGRTWTASADGPRGTLVFDGVAPGSGQLTVFALGAEVTRHVEVTLARVARLGVALPPPADRGLVRVRSERGPAGVSRSRLGGPPGGSSWITHAAVECRDVEAGAWVVETGGASREIDVRLGRIVDVEAVPRERPTERFLGTCPPPFELTEREDGTLVVIRLRPEADGRVLPGDRVVDVERDEGDTLIGAIHGPPRTRVRIALERPDGSRATEVVERTACHDGA